MLLVNARLVPMSAAPAGEERPRALAIEAGRIAWFGRDPPQTARSRIDLGGRLVTPALVDAHTHLVYGGSRADEFEARLQGQTYREIAARGGGILATVRATRAASEDELVASALPRLADGVTTVEIKSGYGLDLATERRMLRAARRLDAETGARIRTTFLGLHALPPEYTGRADAYVDHVCEGLLPALVAEGLVDAVDAFCETIAFSSAQVGRFFERARTLGIPVKLHADQLSDSGGAELAGRYKALSADHLEHASEAGLAALAAAGTVATLLPGAFYTLRETVAPPLERLREHGVPVAIATDCNPGTSPLVSLLLAANFACTFFRMTPDEALAGITRNAARALGLGDRLGTIEVGKSADIAIWDVREPVELVYAIGAMPLAASLREGKPLVEVAGLFSHPHA
jgi:imidazolonepropionase